MNKSYINKIIKTWRTIKMAKLRTLIRNWDESAESIIIPNTYSRIGKDAFNYNLNLKNVVLPDSIVLIGDCAFLCALNYNISIFRNL